MTIGERIKQRRIELRLTQDELAKKLGYSGRSTIACIESGRNQLRQSKIKKIADALDTTPGYLMGWTEEHEDSDEERRADEDFDLIDKFRKLSPKEQKIVLNLIDSFLS